MDRRREPCVLFFPHPAIWAATGALFILATVWARSTGFSVRLLDAGETPALKFYLTAVGGFMFLAAWALRQTRPNVSRTLFAILLFLIFTKISVTLNYLGTRAAFPLCDALLHRADAALGFDWRRHVAWVNSHPSLITVLTFSYRQILRLIALVFVILVILRDFRRLREYMSLLFITMLVVDAFAVFMPAAGAYAFLKPPPDTISNMPEMAGRYWLPHFMALRAGEMHSAAFEKMTGLVSFPSFHTIAALLTTWALRGRVFFWPYAAINALALLSTLSIGGHYLSDVIAGGATFVLAVVIWRALEARADAAPSAAPARSVPAAAGP